MMIPEAWENHRHHGPGPAGLLPVPRRRSWSRGTARRRSPSPTAPSSAPCSTATACARPATGSPTTAWSSWPREVGVLDIDPAQVVRKGRLQPGRMFLVDTAQGRIVDDDEIKADAGRRAPLRRVAGTTSQIHLDDLPPADHAHPPARLGGRPTSGCSATRPRSCGSSSAPMARTGVEPIGSMGTDTPIAVLSDRPRLLYDYFPQLFAQVTNPPLDAIREELVTSLAATIGPERQPARARGRRAAARSCCRMPVIDQRRAGQAALHQRGRRDARASGPSPSTACSTGRAPPGRGEALRPGHRRRARPGQRGHRRRGQDHRAVRPQLHRRAAPRSRRCCWSSPSTTT